MQGARGDASQSTQMAEVERPAKRRLVSSSAGLELIHETADGLSSAGLFSRPQLSAPLTQLEPATASLRHGVHAPAFAALCVSRRQLEQTQFHTRHAADFVSFWSQRALEAAKMPSDRVNALELRPRAVKRIMRAAIMETVKLHKNEQTRSTAAARVTRNPMFPESIARAMGSQGGVVRSSLHERGGGTSALGGAAQQSACKRDEDQDGEHFHIQGDACFVMARACELFAMDVAKRSELAMGDQKRGRGDQAGHASAKLKLQEVLSAIDNTDYCDFLVDIVHSTDL